MGFQKLQNIDSGAPGTAPVTVRLTKRATVVVQIKKRFFETFDGALWTSADVYIGDGADLGKLRIEPTTTSGLVKIAQLKHSVSLNIGRVGLIGPGPSKSHAAVATIDGDAIVLTIPELPQVEVAEDDDDSGDEAEDDEDDAPNYSADDDDADDDVADAATLPAAKGETFDGVTIDLSEGRETVTNRGATAEVTKRQAKLVYLLVKNRTAGSTRAFIRAALWDGNPPVEADQVLTQIITDIADVLAPLKLAVVPKGVGFKLVDL